MDRLKDKVAIVTGAAQGIGEGIARMFAAEGARVALFDRQTELVQVVARDIGSHITLAIAGDVTSSSDLARAVKLTHDTFKRIDIIVNNAAMPPIIMELGAYDLEQIYDKLMATNVRSSWLLLHHALPYLKHRGASIVNIASVHGLAGAGGNSAYSASKGALIAGTRSLAVELAREGIRINCISPGGIWTNTPGSGYLDSLPTAKHEEFLAEFAPIVTKQRELYQPISVAGSPKDVAYCAVYLASDESRFCTGANFVVDGGLTAEINDSYDIKIRAQKSGELHAEIDAWIVKNRPKSVIGRLRFFGERIRRKLRRV